MGCQHTVILNTESWKKNKDRDKEVLHIDRKTEVEGKDKQRKERLTKTENVYQNKCFGIILQSLMKKNIVTHVPFCVNIFSFV